MIIESWNRATGRGAWRPRVRDRRTEHPWSPPAEREHPARGREVRL